MYNKEEVDNSLRERIDLIYKLFAVNRNGNRPLNFENPALVNSAWIEERRRRKPLRLTKLNDERKVQIFEEVVNSVKDKLK